MIQTVKLVSILALTILLSSPATAGIGKGSSVSMRLDAEPPQLGIVPDLEGEVFNVGEVAVFAWWSTDTNPAPHDSNRVAAVLVSDVEVDAVEFSIDFDHIWDWIVPEIVSIDCALELTVSDEFGNTTTVRSGTFSLYAPCTGIPSASAAAVLAAPAPNPFNPQTTLSFTLSTASPATLTVYDLQGRLVRRLFSGELAVGTHTRTWDGRGDDGRRVAGGPYLVRLDAGDGPAPTRKVVLLP